MKNKDRVDFLISALLGIADEDSRGFRALVAHRPAEYTLLEKRGLIYRSTSCVPERCQYRRHHGPTPAGDCRREGWILSLRGRLTVELLREEVPFGRAVWLAENEEHHFTESTIIHRRGAECRGSVTFAADIRELTTGWVRRPKVRMPARREAASVIAGQLARLNHWESLIGDAVSNTAAIRCELANAAHQLRERRKPESRVPDGLK